MKDLSSKDEIDEIEEIREALKSIKHYWIVLFGSRLDSSYIPDRSDIDIAVICRNEDRDANLTRWSRLIGKVPGNYDIRVFELFPLHIQIDIIQNHKVLFGDPLEISEYFYSYRKKWKEMEHRIRENQMISLQEKREGIKRRLQLMDLLIQK